MNTINDQYTSFKIYGWSVHTDSSSQLALIAYLDVNTTSFPNLFKIKFSKRKPNIF